MRKSYRGGYNRMRSFCLQLDGRIIGRGVGLVSGTLRFAQTWFGVFHQINHPILIHVLEIQKISPGSVYFSKDFVTVLPLFL